MKKISCTNREYLDNLRHHAIQGKKLSPDLIFAVNDAITRVSDAEISRIRARADVRAVSIKADALKLAKAEAKKAGNQ